MPKTSICQNFFLISGGFPFYKLSADDALKVVAQNLLLLPVRQVAHQHTADHDPGIAGIFGLSGVAGDEDLIFHAAGETPAMFSIRNIRWYCRYRKYTFGKFCASRTYRRLSH